MKLTGILILMVLTALTGCGKSNTESNSVLQVSFRETNLESISITAGERVDHLPTPDKEGHVFAGWYQDQDLTTVFDLTEPISSDLELYPRWVMENMQLFLSYQVINEKLVIHLNLDDTLTLNGYDLRVRYDSSVLSLDRFNDNIGHVYNDVYDGIIIINFSNVLSSMPIGELFTLDFSVIRQSSTSTAITVDVIEAYYVNDKWEITPLNLQINPIYID